MQSIFLRYLAFDRNFEVQSNVTEYEIPFILD